jgi:hypothetical protein
MPDCIWGNWDQTTRAKIGRAIKVDLRGCRKEDVAVGQTDTMLSVAGGEKIDILSAIWCRHIRVWRRGADKTDIKDLRQVVEARG